MAVILIYVFLVVIIAFAVVLTLDIIAFLFDIVTIHIVAFAVVTYTLSPSPVLSYLHRCSIHL